MTDATPGEAVVRFPLDIDQAELVREAQAHDYAHRPQDRNWTRVSDVQAARLIRGALLAVHRSGEPVGPQDGAEELKQAVGGREALRRYAIRMRESIWTLVGQVEAGEIKSGPEIAAALRRLLGFE